MALDKQTAMTGEETDALLSRRETGVLSLAREEEPYAIPISYGYDATNRRAYMRLVSTPESDKRAFLSSLPEARLVVYEEDDDTYRSAILKGQLEAIEPDDLTAELIEQYGKAKRPLFEMWGEGKTDLDIKLYRLDPEEVSGRKIELDSE